LPEHPSSSLPLGLEHQQPSALDCLVIVARGHGLHLTTSQLIHDNLFLSSQVSVGQTVACALKAGLAARHVRLNWNGLVQLKKALPAIVFLKNGAAMVLRHAGNSEHISAVVLEDPSSTAESAFTIDRTRFENVWNGDVVVVKRNYDLADETKPFSLGLIATLVFRERRIVRDVAISAVTMSFLALSPIIFWRLMTDRVLYYKSMNTFVVLCTTMAILVGSEITFAALRRYLILHLTSRVDVKLSTYMFDKVLNLPVDFFERTAVGKVLHDMNEIWKIRNFLTGQLFGTVLDSFVLLVFFPVMFFFSPIMTAIVFVCCVFIFGWIVVMLPPYRRRTAEVIEAETARGSFLVQTIHGIRTVKSLALDARQRKEWDVLVARVAKTKVAEGVVANLIQTVAMPLERFLVSGAFAIGVYLAMTQNDPVYVGALFAFLLLSQRVAAPLTQLAQLIHQYDEARFAVEIVGRLVNQPAEEGRSSHAVKKPLRGQIEFSNVRFKYQGAEAFALNDVSFEISEGTTLGVMGRSGSGKTTITRLLQGLHSDYRGLIKIDGIDVREYDVDHLRSSLGVVLQENFLFSGTIRENITAAKSDATFDEMVLAARLAGAEEFIDKLPRGYETYVYEGSPNLSGGQRQRLAIARALIVNPRILILDEATSALDAESEAIINANLQRIAQGRTLVVISHRLSSLVPADAILVLERGKVHDVGKHEELLARCDIYSGLWHQQNRHVKTGAVRPIRLPPRGPSAA